MMSKNKAVLMDQIYSVILHKRYEIKQFIRTMSQTYPDLRSKVFGAIQRAPLDGWEKAR